MTVLVHDDHQWQRGEWHVVPAHDPHRHELSSGCWCAPECTARDYSANKFEYHHFDSRLNKGGSSP